MSYLIDVCLCTHNPELQKFKVVLDAITRQTLPPKTWQLIVVDNDSSPPLKEDTFTNLKSRGINIVLVREPVSGVLNARRKAVEVATSPWILFVDDDNVISDDYLETGLDYATKHKEIACFGGRILLQPEIKVEKWIKQLLPLLAIRDYGKNEVVSRLENWGPWMPPSAGLFIRNEIAKRFFEVVDTNKAYESLGRRGKQLKSGLDYMMVKEGPLMGYACAYTPELKLTHILDPRRLTFGYMLKINWAYGRSHVIIRNIERNRKKDFSKRRRNRLVIIAGIPLRIFNEFLISPLYGLCKMAYRCGYFWQRSITYFALKLGI